MTFGLNAQGSPCDLGAWEPPFDHKGNDPTASPVGGCVFNPPLSQQQPFFEQPSTKSKYMALHASLIPVGQYQGQVLVWSHKHITTPPDNEVRVRYWSIVDPVSKGFINNLFCNPEGKGDLFCAGHAWTSDGRLLVAGGSGQHATVNNPTGWGGAKMAELFDPQIPYNQGNPAASNPWGQLTDMQKARWYPSVTNLGHNRRSPGRDTLIVSGGHDFTAFHNDYEPWLLGFTYPAPGVWQALGPVLPHGGSTYALWDYPRVMLMENGLAVTAGFMQGSSQLDHSGIIYSNPTWLPMDPGYTQSVWREYGTAVLFGASVPQSKTNVILSIGGRREISGNYFITNKVEVSDANASGAGKHWFSSPATDLAQPRWFCNSVLLADGTPLVVGGDRSPSNTDFKCAISPVYSPELLVGGVWKSLASSHIIRDYHSTALLLPSGKVLTAGGESRQYQPVANCSDPKVAIAGESDYQIFVPPYINCGAPRPVITNPAPAGSAKVVKYGQTLQMTYQQLPLGVSVERVMIAWPGSVTHHADTNQRVVELDSLHIPDTEPPTPGYQPTIQVSLPPQATHEYMIPRGYYMMFLITNQGTPSEAVWIKVEQ